MVVFGLGFLVFLAGIVYLGTERTKLDTAPVLEQSQNQPLPPVMSEEGVETSETATESGVVSDDSAGEPAPLPQGKIDVKVACESALMYTTFADGASADAFVAECIEGKHPDVIERFISELGIDSATI